ncbi:MAG: helix-turn-helix transcriptional regulator [Ectothiorhodospiraceae bacterium]|nr:helix-turn-helix transcriptional regulator [Ectothiorhodospiraceae bacterium]
MEPLSGSRSGGVTPLQREAVSPQALPRFMNVHQVARYLSLNERKVYTLAGQGNIPATKITGKWIFPRELIDRWLLESSHGGLLTDRLAIAGSDDPLLHRVVTRLTHGIRGQALVSYSSTGARDGLNLLARRHADICALHWGPATESGYRHGALLTRYAQHTDWVLVRAFCRDQGLLLRPGAAAPDTGLKELLQTPLRWVMRQPGAGAQRLLREALARSGLASDAFRGKRVAESFCERDAASRLVSGDGDIAPGSRAAAREYALHYISVDQVAIDLALYRGVYFRKLFQRLLACLDDAETRRTAGRLGGYDFSRTGTIIWSP